MGVHAHPRGLHQPLQGGQEGATVTVEPLLCGEWRLPPNFLEKAEGRLWKLRYYGIGVPKSSWQWVPLPAFLIRHPVAGPILVDTGMHPSVATDPKQNLGRLVTALTEIRVKPEQVLSQQLRERGIDRAQIDLVLLTHLHYDHASGISEFPGATFVVSEAEWEAATTVSRPALHGYRLSHFDFAFDYRTVDFTRPAIGSYATFGRAFDLFGDGSLRLIHTPGHTPGHYSVIARLSGGRELLIAGDAIYTIAQLEGGPEPPMPWDRRLWRRSLQELQLYKKERPEAAIIAGHDIHQWSLFGRKFE